MLSRYAPSQKYGELWKIIVIYYKPRALVTWNWCKCPANARLLSPPDFNDHIFKIGINEYTEDCEHFRKALFWEKLKR